VLLLIPPGDHEVLVFLVELVVILTVARTLGFLLSRLGQPAVVGELLAGIVLGPSILGRLAPGVFDWLFPPAADQGAMLYGVAWIGLLLLLAATGLESDLGVLTRLGRPAVLVTAGSLLVPLTVGFAVGFAVPAVLLGPEATTVVFAAFLAVALSISSLPVVARVLTELGMIRRNVGQLILAAAMSNDVIGWILLGLVAGLAGTGAIDLGGLGLTLLAVGLFLGLSMTVGQRMIDGVLRSVAVTNGPATTGALVVVVFVFAMGAITQALHVEAVLGAFVAGLVVGRSRWRDERVVRLIETVAYGLFAPVFFASAGLRVDLGVFTDPQVAWWSLIIVAVASVTKFVGAMAGARAGGLPNREGLALGAGLNARGALEIVIATVGLQLGVLNEASFGVIVVMAIATSVATPPLLRFILRGYEGTEAERQRLRDEERARSRLLLSDRPPLLPSRGGPPSILAAQVVDLAWPPDTPVTVLTVGDDQADLTPVTNVLGEREVRVVPRAGVDPLEAVRAETVRGHGALVLGVPARAEGPLLSPLVDHQIMTSPVPVVLVRPEQISGRPIPGAFARAIVPVTGTMHSRAAQELAFALGASLGTELLLTHLDASPRLPYPLSAADGGRQPLGTADPLLRRAVEAARTAGVTQHRTIAQATDNVATRLLQLAIEEEADLIVLGATRRELDEVSHLGTVASHLLQLSPTTLIIVVTPPGWAGWHREHG
jgi:Kef-type K+ transport system membrane component KefB/nucleotide-binding universal stress UspA family protein